MNLVGSARDDAYSERAKRMNLCVDSPSLNHKDHVRELRVVHHRLQVAGEAQHRRGGRLLQRQLEAVVKVSPSIVPAEDEEA